MDTNQKEINHSESAYCRSCAGGNLRFLFTSKNVHGRHLLSEDRFEIFECHDCKAIFTNTDVSDAYYRKYYPDNYYEEHPSNNITIRLQKILDWTIFSNKLKLINRYKPEGNKLLEIGCAKGLFLNRLSDSFDKYGVEINPLGYQFIKDNYQDITVYNEDISKNPLDTGGVQFDMIAIWHVLEHIAKPDSFFKNLTKLLAKDGIIIMTVPNGNSLGFRFTKEAWFHLDTPRHLFFFRHDYLQAMLKKHKLQILKMVSEPVEYFQDFPFSILKKLNMKNRIVTRLLAPVIVPTAIGVRLFIALFLPHLAELNTYIIKKEAE
jgi:2-polyprenyl-3-methyl-5-hydroxy-6-metoxy-1,4-benzoquinol methylase